ncbi:hypothetical protein [Nocardioides sp.]|uniref:hypothetical protein n=1 Tax=Nocardioides sp. TaxID=35761 RepID=UPI00351940FD
MPRKTIVPIYDGDDDIRLHELRMAVEIAERAALKAEGVPRRFGDDESPSAELDAARAAYDAFVDEAAERAEEWTVSAIGHEAFRQLLAEHPPRQVEDPKDPAKKVDHPEDAGWGFNLETFPKALLLFVDPEDGEHRTILSVSGLDLASLGKKLRRLSDGEFQTLWTVAYTLNTSAVADPKATRFSTGAQRSDET